MMKVIERNNDDIRKVIDSDSQIINTFRKRMYYLSALLETSQPKKPYNRLLAEYLDGTGPQIDINHGFLYSEEN